MMTTEAYKSGQTYERALLYYPYRVAQRDSRIWSLMDGRDWCIEQFGQPCFLDNRKFVDQTKRWVFDRLGIYLFKDEADAVRFEEWIVSRSEA